MGIIKKWNSLSLIIRILIGLVIGAVLGFTVPKQTWIGVPGELFVGALKAIAPILVFVLVAASLATSKGGNMQKFRTVIVLYLLSTLCAAIISVFSSFLFPITMPLSNLDAADTAAAPQGMSEVVLNLLKSVYLIHLRKIFRIHAHNVDFRLSAANAGTKVIVDLDADHSVRKTANQIIHKSCRKNRFARLSDIGINDRIDSDFGIGRG